LPVLSYIEKGGSFINIEGRVQTLMPGKEIPANIYSDGEIFSQIAQKLKISLDVDLKFSSQMKAGRLPLAPRVVKTTSSSTNAANPLPDLAATFTHLLFDDGVRMQHDSHVKWLAKKPMVRLHPNEGAKRGIQDGENIQIQANGKTIRALVKLDPLVAEKTLVIPLGFEEKIPVYELGLSLFNGLPVEIKKEGTV